MSGWVRGHALYAKQSHLYHGDFRWLAYHTNMTSETELQSAQAVAHIKTTHRHSRVSDLINKHQALNGSPSKNASVPSDAAHAK